MAPPASAPKVLGFWRVPFFYGWVIVGAAFVSEFMAAGVGSFIVPLFFKPLTAEMGWSLTLLTGIFTAQTIAHAAVSPIMGPMLDRLGARPIMVFGAIIAGVGMAMLTRVQTIWQLWVLYAAVGALGLSEMSGLTSSIMVTKWFVRKRGKALAASTLGNPLGGAIMASVVGLLIANIGWRNTMGVMGILLMAVMVPVALVFVRRQPEDFGLLPDGDVAGEAVSAEPSRVARTEESWTVKEALRTRTLWFLIIALNMSQLAIHASTFHLVPYLTLQMGKSAATAGFILTFRLLASICGRVVWGFATDRFPMHLCLGVGVLSRSLGPALIVLLPFPVNIIAMIAVNVPGSGFQVLQPVAFANYYGRKHSGAIQGITRPLMTAGSLIGPLALSYVFDVTGTFNIVFLIASAMGVIGSAFAFFSTAPVRRDGARSKEQGPKVEA